MASGVGSYLRFVGGQAGETCGIIVQHRPRPRATRQGPVGEDVVWMARMDPGVSLSSGGAAVGPIGPADSDGDGGRDSGSWGEEQMQVSFQQTGGCQSYGVSWARVRIGKDQNIFLKYGHFPARGTTWGMPALR